MHFLIGAFAVLLLLSGPALAADTEGTIKAIDRDKQTITLDNGQSYQLPGEFDINAIEEGMDVVIAYDKVKGQNLITDMELPQ